MVIALGSPVAARAWSRDRTRSCTCRADRRRRPDRHWDRRVRARRVAAGAAGVAAGFGVAAGAAGFLAGAGGLGFGFAAARLGGVAAAGASARLAPRALAVSIRQPARIDMGRRTSFRRYPCSARAFPAAACACLIACSTSFSAAAAPRGSAQMKSPTRTKSAPAGGECAGFLARGGKADARRLEQFGPPFAAARRSPRPTAAGPSRRARRTTRSRRRLRPRLIESCRVASPPTPAMRSGFSDGSASSSAAMPLRCAPSAPPRATSST